MTCCLKLLLIGSGAWGKNYIKTLQNFDIELSVANRYNWKQLIDKKPNGVIVCTPPQFHTEIARYSLEYNIPTMIEKPLSLSLEDAKSLNGFSAPILVNHIHLFSEQYENIKKKISVNNITHISSQGFNIGPYRDYSSLWDYGPHDLSMILDILGRTPDLVNANKYITNNGAMYSIDMTFGKITTKSLVGNGGSFKQRLLSIDSHQKFVYDDSIPSKTKPLSNALEVFIKSINGGHDYRLGLDLSFMIIDILERCSKKCEILGINNRQSQLSYKIS